MEYLFQRHSDLYAGAKGQQWIGGRKTATAIATAKISQATKRQA